MGRIWMPPAGNGADPEGVTATASQVLAGRTFWNSAGELVEGTLQSFAPASSYTFTTSTQTIASGKYMTGDIIINGVANLTAGNIKKGVKIGSVTGTYGS